ncbi:MAG: serine hydrolase [Flavobacteriales bacterium]
MGRSFVYNFADIRDYKKFPSRELSVGETKFQFATTENGRYPRAIKYGLKEDSVTFDWMLKDNNTVAFIIIKNDTIQYENYFSGYDEESIVPSFSMAKSITSILIGCAIDDGLILSRGENQLLNTSRTCKKWFEKVTIKHVLQMTSAIDFNESYINPLTRTTSYYYGRNLDKQIFKLKLKGNPGEKI